MWRMRRFPIVFLGMYCLYGLLLSLIFPMAMRWVFRDTMGVRVPDTLNKPPEDASVQMSTQPVTADAISEADLSIGVIGGSEGPTTIFIVDGGFWWLWVIGKILSAPLELAMLVSPWLSALLCGAGFWWSLRTYQRMGPPKMVAA